MCILNCARGTCVDGSCICDPGFSQSLDYSYFVDKRFSFVDNVTLFATLPCDQNETAIKTLYLIAIILILLSILAYAQLIRKTSQVKRLLPFFFSNGLVTAGLIYKLQNFDDPAVAYGIDIFFTISFLLSQCFGGAYLLNFIQKWIRWEEKLIAKKENVDPELENFKKTQKISFVLICLAPIPVITTLFVDDKNFAYPLAILPRILMFVTVVYAAFGADFFLK
eukprot:snap_masked-scaffold_72-processed-gene-0.29-mRNA-1 protein AED:1.00 eAED:1.00 QI:0/-1/0/0/-1/1/1/0/222